MLCPCSGMRAALLGILLFLTVDHAAAEAKEPWSNQAPHLKDDLPEDAWKGGVHVQGKGSEKPQDRGAETEYGFGYQQREFAEHPVFPVPLLRPAGKPFAARPDVVALFQRLTLKRHSEP